MRDKKKLILDKCQNVIYETAFNMPYNQVNGTYENYQIEQKLDKFLTKLIERGESLYGNDFTNALVNEKNAKSQKWLINDIINDIMYGNSVDIESSKEEKFETVNSKENNNFIFLLNKALLGTQINYPDASVAESIVKQIMGAWDNITQSFNSVGLVKDNLGSILICFSRESKLYGIPLRTEIIHSLKSNEEYYAYEDLINGIFKAISNGAKQKAKTETHNNKPWQAVATIACCLNNVFTNKEGVCEELKKHEQWLQKHPNTAMPATFADAVLQLYGKASMEIDQIIKDNGIINLERYLTECLDTYIKSLSHDILFVDPKIEIVDVSQTALEVLTNSFEYGLKDSFSGKLIEGNIQLATDRGYPTWPNKPQQDAIGSAVRNEHCFINIVADGVGGSKSGEDASKYLVDSLIEWFNNLSNDQLNDFMLLSDLLNIELNRINNEIYNKHSGQGQTTMVLALTVNDKTIVANIGDSTAYGYKEESDELEMLSTLDSLSYGLSYEDARHNPDNNVITSSIGSGQHFPVHINIINNNGQKIILSSDGVTDLISEKRFKSYFKSDIDAQNIVNDALSKVDIDSMNMKAEDNISVIVVNLPNGGFSKGRGAM